MTTNITIPIDNSILLSLKTTREEFTQQMLFASALSLYRQSKLSLGKAAELAGYSRMAFIEELARREEPVFDFSNEEVDELITQADVVDKLLESRK